MILKEKTDEKQQEVQINESVSDEILGRASINGLETEKKINEQTSRETVGMADEIEKLCGDITPSKETMKFVDPDPYEYDGDGDQNFSITPKGKALIAIYAAVLITIIALIIMNAKVLKNMQKSIEEEKSAIETLAQQTQNLEQELTYISGEEVISQKAVEMGMSK